MSKLSQLAAKRLTDVLFSLLGLALLSPLFLLIGIAIKLDSKGPIFYRASRIGKDGRPFIPLKFRTLVHGARRGELDKISKDDPRITRVGRFLREWGLDELPQLWNVLKGEMSLVGPRPTFRYQVEQYDENQRRRLSVRPGITGWALIHGRNALSWEKRIEYDLWYVDHWSVSLDLRILLRTVWIILRRKGVYGPGGVNDTFVKPPDKECESL